MSAWCLCIVEDLRLDDVTAHWHPEVKRTGNSRYVTIPKEHADADVVVVIRRAKP